MLGNLPEGCLDHVFVLGWGYVSDFHASAGRHQKEQVEVFHANVFSQRHDVIDLVVVLLSQRGVHLDKHAVLLQGFNGVNGFFP